LMKLVTSPVTMAWCNVSVFSFQFLVSVFSI
jgi:hypothetical protein